jgi:hypothetical protein
LRGNRPHRDAVFIVERSIDSEARATGGVPVRGNVPGPLVTLHRYELWTGVDTALLEIRPGGQIAGGAGYRSGFVSQSAELLIAWYSPGEIDRRSNRHATTKMFLLSCQLV